MCMLSLAKMAIRQLLKGRLVHRCPFVSVNRPAVFRAVRETSSAHTVVAAHLAGTIQTRARHSIVTMATSAAAAPTKVAFEPNSWPSLSVSTASTADWEGDLLLVAVTEEDLAKPAEGSEGPVTLSSQRLKDLDAASGGAISDAIAPGGFEGKQGQQSSVVRVGSAPGLKAKRVGLLGLGAAAKATTVVEWGASAWQTMGTAIAGLAKSNKVKSVGVYLPDTPAQEADATAAVSQVAAGVLSGGFESTRFRSKPNPSVSKLESAAILVPAAAQAAAQAAVTRAQATAAGNALTRYLVEAPPNICTPTHLAEAAAHIAALAPQTMKLTIHDKAACQAMGMGLYLSVSEASEEPPQFIHLTYTSPGEGDKKKIAVVGKGLTFDSGGYNLKAGPGSMIEMMKFDMGGAGATLGAARMIAGLAPAGVEVHFIIAACENMVAGKGLRPGDIITGASGKTVEVNNTDAEGRLTLADALWYAQEKCGVTAVVDIATLTGACMIALGTDIAGLMTHSDAMAEQVSKAAKAAGEKVWRLPLEMSYFEQLKSSCADMKNTGARYGGTITAACFLKQFIKEGVEWAHLDVAGPVWDQKANIPTGFGAATLTEWILANSK